MLEPKPRYEFTLSFRGYVYDVEREPDDKMPPIESHDDIRGVILQSFKKDLEAGVDVTGEILVMNKVEVSREELEARISATEKQVHELNLRLDAWR